jgi:hypothetical protein
MFRDGAAFESALPLLAVNQRKSHIGEVTAGYMNIPSYHLLTLSHVFFIPAYFHKVRILLLKGLRLWQTTHSQKLQVKLRWATLVQEAQPH